ncbi:MAG: metallophosphoesterase [Myxococcales bacterium]|nr:metallophosphoesterase [Myxococcales bacterium]
MARVAHYAFERPVAVLGDLHGRLDLLDRLLPRLADRALVVIGDVVDRGPDTRGTIDRLLERGAVGVRGNHEEWVRAFVRGEELDPFAILPKMGGLATLRSYGAIGDTVQELEGQAWRIPEAHRRFLGALAIAARLDVPGQSYWLIHAGVPAHVSFEGVPFDGIVPWLVEHHAQDLLWSKNDPEMCPPIDRPVIMGHRPRVDPLDTGDVLAIDTGAGSTDGRLTALLLPERAFVTVGAD